MPETVSRLASVTTGANAIPLGRPETDPLCAGGKGGGATATGRKRAERKTLGNLAAAADRISARLEKRLKQAEVRQGSLADVEGEVPGAPTQRTRRQG